MSWYYYYFLKCKCGYEDTIEDCRLSEFLSINSYHCPLCGNIERKFSYQDKICNLCGNEMRGIYEYPTYINLLFKTICISPKLKCPKCGKKILKIVNF